MLLSYLFLLFRTLYASNFRYKIDSLEEYSLAKSFTCFSFYLFSMVENPVKSRITKSRKNLDEQDKIDLKKQTLSSGLKKSIAFNSYLPYGKDLHELNKEQRLIKWRKRFLRVRRQLLNNVNSGINFSTADNESKKGNLNT